MKKVLGFLVVVAVLLVGAMMLSAQNQGNNQIDNGPKYWGGPQYYFNTLNIPAGDLYVGGAVVTSTAYTGAVTYVAMSNSLATSSVVFSNVTLLATNTRGAVVANVLTNLPTSCETNAQFFQVTIGSVKFAVPCYKLP